MQPIDIVKKNIEEFDEEFCRVYGIDVYVQDPSDGLHKKEILEKNADKIKKFISKALQQAREEERKEIVEMINNLTPFGIGVPQDPLVSKDAVISIITSKSDVSK